MAERCEIRHGITTTYRWNRSKQSDGSIVSYPEADAIQWRRVGRSVALAAIVLAFTQSHSYAYQSSCVSNIPDPEIVLSRVYELVPHIRTIVVIHYSENTKLLTAAESAARRLHLSLDSYSVSTLYEYSKKHHELISQMKRDSALWLINPPPQSLLNEILLIAWERRLVLISNSDSLSRQGVLISVMAKHSSYCGNFQTETLTTVNMRMAGRLGLTFTQHQLRLIDSIYPR